MASHEEKAELYSKKPTAEITVHEIADALHCFAQVYNTHVFQLRVIRAERKELIELFLKNVKRPLTAEEASLMRVCRICRGNVDEDGSTERISMIHSYGLDFAHKRCLEWERKKP